MKRDHRGSENSKSVESQGRRKALKTIVGGVTALAAYNVLPVKWGTPIIEQVFLPAHAATSGEVANRYFVDDTNGDGHFHLLIVNTANNTGSIIHINERQWVRREGAISFAVGATSQLAVTGVGGNACVSPPGGGNHTIEITNIQPSSVVYNFTHRSGPFHSGWVFTEVGSMPAIPGLLPCTSII